MIEGTERSDEPFERALDTIDPLAELLKRLSERVSLGEATEIEALDQPSTEAAREPIKLPLRTPIKGHLKELKGKDERQREERCIESGGEASD